MAALSKYTHTHSLSQPVPGGGEGVVFLMKDAINTTYLTKAEYTQTPTHIHTQTANEQHNEFKDFNLSLWWTRTIVFTIMGWLLSVPITSIHLQTGASILAGFQKTFLIGDLNITDYYYLSFIKKRFSYLVSHFHCVVRSHFAYSKTNVTAP